VGVTRRERGINRGNLLIKLFCCCDPGTPDQKDKRRGGEVKDATRVGGGQPSRTGTDISEREEEKSRTPRGVKALRVRE